MSAQDAPVITTSDMVTLNFVNADIEGVVRVVSELTGRNFIIDPRVVGTINIISAQPVPRDTVYTTFLSALRLHGYAVIEDSDVVRIVPEADARLYSGPVSGPGSSPAGAGDQLVTRVFALQHESAAQLMPILRPLIAPNNVINAYQNSNTLVITDYAGNLERIAKVIAAIDQPGTNGPVVIQLEHASAVDLARTINQLFPEATLGGVTAEPTQRFTVVADPRSNSLLVNSGDPARLVRLHNFVAMLDTPTSTAGNIHVVYLKNAEAVKLAETLRAIYAGETATTTAPVPTAEGQPAAGIIQADAATNSIIIIAPDAIYNNLRAALDKLDVRRAQVYVEALIVELTADRAAEFGVQWQNLSALGESGSQGFGGTNFGGTGQNILSTAVNPASIGSGLNVGVVDGSISLPGLDRVLNISLLIRALESDANANILSTPTLLTLDNEEAEIIIGQNVPFVTGQFALSGAAVTPSPFQTIERHDVGLTLRIKPQISEGGTVRLQIYQEVSSINDKSNPAGVITNKRAVASTVLVDDGQIVVIGGLIQDNVTANIQRVPVLGSIPVLGSLFRYENRKQGKTNLMIFLRPTLVRDSQGADVFTGERYDYIIGEQEAAALPPSALLPDLSSPVLPPLPQTPTTTPVPSSTSAPRP
ncbi:MAG: type II secretion system secretin GspD [Gammaproteobacteria bacterium]|nr:type II secretion system secretin GspD [Gammaproteobacteria bacterium]